MDKYTYRGEYETVEFQVGKPVGFKYDVEQYSEVLEIDARRQQVLVTIWEGEYATPGTQMWIEMDRCWN